MPGMTTPPVKTKSRGFETVREYRLFEESVEKELKCLKVWQNFQKRPHQCTAIAEKVTQQCPLAANCSQNNPEYRDIVQQAERSVLCSTDKTNFPDTSAQEVGWIIKKQIEKNERWRQDGTSYLVPRCASAELWRSSLSQCDIVKSFENYVSFKKDNGVPSGKPPQKRVYAMAFKSKFWP